jgi:8-hydroxy-5-deazaflavin:NADPH oxidoreductase
MAAIGIIGGTGALGRAIGRRLVKSGHAVTVGSRNPANAAQTAAKLGAAEGAANVEAAADKDFVLVTVPYSAHAATLDDIARAVGTAIVIDATVPLVPPKVMRVQLPAVGCAALEAKALLGEGVRLVSAFHSVAAHKLATDETVDCDVLVFSDDVDARAATIEIVADCGLRGLSGGSLANSAAAEALTSVLIYMNKTYGADGAGIRFTGLVNAPPIG